MTKKRFSGKWYLIAIVLTLFSISSSGVVSAAQQDRFNILSFSNISSEKGAGYLTQVGVGDVSALPGSPSVLVTSSVPANLQKAKVIRDLVDCTQEYAVKFVPFTANKLPSSKQIINSIGTLTIGNFSNPPANDGHARTIVDICDNKVIVIAPANKVDRIANAITELQNTKVVDDSVEEILFIEKDESVEKPVAKIKEFNITPSLLAANVSNNIDNLEDINMRITGSAPIEEASSNVEPVEINSDLLAANSLADSIFVDISSIPNPDDEISLNLTDQLTLLEFIGMVGPLLHMDFLYNPKELVGDITINPNGVLKGNIKIRDLYTYLDEVLQFKGFAMVRGKNSKLVTIVPKASVGTLDPIIIDEDTVGLGDAVIIKTFELKNISTAAAESLITKMQLGIQITAIPENKTLIITEYASRMPRIQALLNIVDKPGDPKKFRFRQLKHTYPHDLVPKVQSLAEKLDNLSITISTLTAAGGAVPPRPEKRNGESDASYNNRIRQWEAQVRQATAEAGRGATPPTPTTVGGESIASTVFIDYDERTNRVLMIGLDQQLDTVEELIDTLDVAQEDPRKLRIYKIEYLDAEEVMNKLQDLNVIPKAENSKESSRTTRAAAPGPRITAEPETRETVAEAISSGSGSDSGTLQAVGEEPLAVLVASTNSLLVNATELQHEHISAVISLIDKEREDIPFKIYQLKNTDPQHVLEILEPLIEETIMGAEDKIQSTVPKQDEQITIVADPNTSSLIVNANKKNQDWIESLITVLDKRRPQVLIDVTLVQISKNDVFNYDLNVISSIPDLTTTSGLTSAILPNISSGASNLVQPLLDSGRKNFLDFQSNGGAGTGFYGDKHINTLLTMMQEKDYGRIMAKPQILVNDNQMGSISTTDITYVIKETSTIIEGVSQAIPTAKEYEGYDAGIKLEITPHISESDLLRLDILLTRKDFGTITGERPPDTTDSTVQTKVTIPDGSTIILGGMLKMNQSKGGSRVPLLSSIPVLGSLFKSVNNSDIQRNLYVFVKAEIIRPPDEDKAGQIDLERISKQNKESFEEFEKEFQDYQSFTGIKSKPMEPAKVLEY